eukprot:gene5363-5580_t
MEEFDDTRSDSHDALNQLCGLYGSDETDGDGDLQHLFGGASIHCAASARSPGVHTSSRNMDDNVSSVRVLGDKEEVEEEGMFSQQNEAAARPYRHHSPFRTPTSILTPSTTHKGSTDPKQVTPDESGESPDMDIAVGYHRTEHGGQRTQEASLDQHEGHCTQEASLNQAAAPGSRPPLQLVHGQSQQAAAPGSPSRWFMVKGVCAVSQAILFPVSCTHIIKDFQSPPDSDLDVSSSLSEGSSTDRSSTSFDSVELESDRETSQDVGASSTPTQRLPWNPHETSKGDSGGSKGTSLKLVDESESRSPDCRGKPATESKSKLTPERGGTMLDTAEARRLAFGEQYGHPAPTSQSQEMNAFCVPLHTAAVTAAAMSPPTGGLGVTPVPSSENPPASTLYPALPRGRAGARLRAAAVVESGLDSSKSSHPSVGGALVGVVEETGLGMGEGSKSAEVVRSGLGSSTTTAAVAELAAADTPPSLLASVVGAVITGVAPQALQGREEDPLWDYRGAEAKGNERENMGIQAQQRSSHNPAAPAPALSTAPPTAPLTATGTALVPQEPPSAPAPTDRPAVAKWSHRPPMTQSRIAPASRAAASDSYLSGPNCDSGGGGAAAAGAAGNQWGGRLPPPQLMAWFPPYSGNTDSNPRGLNEDMRTNALNASSHAIDHYANAVCASAQAIETTPGPHVLGTPHEHPSQAHSTPAASAAVPAFTRTSLPADSLNYESRPQPYDSILVQPPHPSRLPISPFLHEAMALEPTPLESTSLGLCRDYQAKNYQPHQQQLYQHQPSSFHPSRQADGMASPSYSQSALHAASQYHMSTHPVPPFLSSSVVGMPRRETPSPKTKVPLHGSPLAGGTPHHTSPRASPAKGIPRAAQGHPQPVVHMSTPVHASPHRGRVNDGRGPPMQMALVSKEKEDHVIVKATRASTITGSLSLGHATAITGSLSLGPPTESLMGLSLNSGHAAPLAMAPVASADVERRVMQLLMLKNAVCIRIHKNAMWPCIHKHAMQLLMLKNAVCIRIHKNAMWPCIHKHALQLLMLKNAVFIRIHKKAMWPCIHKHAMWPLMLKNAVFIRIHKNAMWPCIHKHVNWPQLLKNAEEVHVQERSVAMLAHASHQQEGVLGDGMSHAHGGASVSHAGSDVIVSARAHHEQQAEWNLWQAQHGATVSHAVGQANTTARFESVSNQQHSPPTSPRNSHASLQHPAPTSSLNPQPTLPRPPATSPAKALNSPQPPPVTSLFKCLPSLLQAVGLLTPDGSGSDLGGEVLMLLDDPSLSTLPADLLQGAAVPGALGQAPARQKGTGATRRVQARTRDKVVASVSPKHSFDSIPELRKETSIPQAKSRTIAGRPSVLSSPQLLSGKGRARKRGRPSAAALEARREEEAKRKMAANLPHFKKCRIAERLEAVRKACGLEFFCKEGDEEVGDDSRPLDAAGAVVERLAKDSHKLQAIDHHQGAPSNSVALAMTAILTSCKPSITTKELHQTLLLWLWQGAASGLAGSAVVPAATLALQSHFQEQADAAPKLLCTKWPGWWQVLRLFVSGLEDCHLMLLDPQELDQGSLAEDAGAHQASHVAAVVSEYEVALESTQQILAADAGAHQASHVAAPVREYEVALESAQPNLAGDPGAHLASHVAEEARAYEVSHTSKPPSLEADAGTHQSPHVAAAARLYEVSHESDQPSWVADAKAEEEECQAAHGIATAQARVETSRYEETHGEAVSAAAVAAAAA